MDELCPRFPLQPASRRHAPSSLLRPLAAQIPLRRRATSLRRLRRVTLAAQVQLPAAAARVGAGPPRQVAAAAWDGLLRLPLLPRPRILPAEAGHTKPQFWRYFAWMRCLLGPLGVYPDLVGEAGRSFLLTGQIKMIPAYPTTALRSPDTSADVAYFTNSVLFAPTAFIAVSIATVGPSPHIEISSLRQVS
jgi:hypothetical protein